MAGETENGRLPVIGCYLQHCVCAKIGTEKTSEKKDMKLLGIIVDNELKLINMSWKFDVRRVES